MAKAVVTGGAGFIGSHVAELLVEKNFEVTVIDNLSFGKKENLAGIEKDIVFAKGDIREKEFLKNYFDKADVVFHLAALHFVGMSVEKTSDYNSVNIDGTLSVLQAAKETGVKRVVFSSSSSVYGDCTVFPQKESLIPNPKSPYAITKLAGEQLMKYFFDVFDLENVSLRYFNVFGPRMDAESKYTAVIPNFISKVMKNERPTIYGDGKQSRDFTFVKDAALANLAAATAGKKAMGKAINIANGKSISINSVLEQINMELGKNIRPVHAPARKEDVFRTQADNALAKELLSFECTVPFEIGLKKTIEWFREHEK